MDGTFAGDGPGPRCMTPHVKNVILASADQVAIDAVAARLMGFDPLRDVCYIRLAHEKGLGWRGHPGHPHRRGCRGGGGELALRRPLQAHDLCVAKSAPHLLGPTQATPRMVASQLAGAWSYVASVGYHDVFWYPRNARRQMADAMQSDWGRLFLNWESANVEPGGRDMSGRTPSRPARGGTGLTSRAGRD